MTVKIIIQDLQIHANLYGVAFVNCCEGVAVGAGGTVITTNDGGVSWTSQISGYAGSFRDVAFAGASRMVAVGDECTILMSGDEGKTWFAPTTVPSFLEPAEKNLLAGVNFKDEMIGYAVGIIGAELIPRAVVLTTDDGGDTWGFEFVLPESANTITDVAFSAMDGTEYVVVVGAGTTGIGGLIIRAEIGTTNWSIAPSPTLNELFGIAFAKAPYEKYGWAVGREGTIVNTTDGGATWNVQTSGKPDELLLRVAAIDDKHACVVSINGSLIATNDGGENWIQLNTDGGLQLHDVSYCCSCLGTIVGVSATVLTVLGRA